MSGRNWNYTVDPMSGYLYNQRTTEEPKFGSKLRNQFTTKWPRSIWFYICYLPLCIIAGLGLAMGIVLLVLFIVSEVNDSSTPMPTSTPSSTPSPTNLMLLNAQITPTIQVPFSNTELDNNTTIIVGPQGPPGPKGDPGEADFSNVGSITIKGTAEDLLPPTRVSNGVSVKVENGDVEILNGSLYTEGIVATNTQFASPPSTPSDIRIKKDIIPRNTSKSLSSIMEIKPVTYSFIDEWVEHTKMENRDEIGFIAQEIKKVYPCTVSIAKHKVLDIDDLNVLNTRPIIADLVGSVQELAKIIESQQKNIEELKLIVNLLNKN
jgi:hypothetical protein